MKIDLGFWENGQYKEDIQEVEMNELLSINDINLLQGQIKRLTEQNRELQEEVKQLKTNHREWVKKTKDGMDAQEYCLQNLERDYEKLQEENKKLKEVIEDLKYDNEQGRKITSADIDKFQEIEELCKLAKYKGGDDIYYDDILDLVQKWIYSEEE